MSAVIGMWLCWSYTKRLCRLTVMNVEFASPGRAKGSGISNAGYKDAQESFA